MTATPTPIRRVSIGATNCHESLSGSYLHRKHKHTESMKLQIYGSNIEQYISIHPLLKIYHISRPCSILKTEMDLISPPNGIKWVKMALVNIKNNSERAECRKVEGVENVCT